jgi:hypothetical protein
MGTGELDGRNLGPGEAIVAARRLRTADSG